jgi:hypothetical protein
MDALSALWLLGLSMALLGLFDVAAVRWGADSRPTIGDDHRR